MCRRKGARRTGRSVDRQVRAIAGRECLSANRLTAWRRRLRPLRRCRLHRFRSAFRNTDQAGLSADRLEEIRHVHALVALPIFCIGGIKLENLRASDLPLAPPRRHRLWLAARRRHRRVCALREGAARSKIDNRKSKIRNNMSVLIVGSIALDTVKTPVEEHADQLGGSASYAALGASFFSPGQTGWRGRR